MVCYIAVAVFLLVTSRWLPLVAAIGAALTEIDQTRHSRQSSKMRILGDETFDILVTFYIVWSVPLVIACVQLASFASLTVAQLCLRSLVVRKRESRT